MEPITHFLTGACIGRAGLNRKTAYATLAAVLAAEAADIDILWSFAGPVEELKHHRGITHTFIAVPVVAAAAVGVVWLFDRWRQRRQQRKLEIPAIAAEGMTLDDNTIPQGLKPNICFGALTARLKSCPDTSCNPECVLPQPVKPEDSIAIPAARLKPRPFKAAVPAQEI